MGKRGVNSGWMCPENRMSCRPTLGTCSVHHPPSGLIVASHFLGPSCPVGSMSLSLHFLVITCWDQIEVVTHLSPHCPEAHLHTAAHVLYGLVFTENRCLLDPSFLNFHRSHPLPGIPCCCHPPSKLLLSTWALTLPLLFSAMAKQPSWMYIHTLNVKETLTLKWT